MNRGEDIRWHQRFQNFSKAFALLDEAIGETEIDALSPLEQEGVIQRFEYTFELAWKTAKDYLEASGIRLAEVSPRAVIKEAFAVGLISDGQVFIDMMLSRNQLSHMYDNAKFRDVLCSVKTRYLSALGYLHAFLEERKP